LELGKSWKSNSKLTQQTSGGLSAVHPVQGEGKGAIRGKSWLLLREIGRDDRGHGADALCAQCLGTSSPRPHR
jgi:hypothetical protein